MKITGTILVIMVAVLNMLPFAALAANNPVETKIECHCEAMKSIQQKASYSQKQKKSYLISCSSSDRQTQNAQNHSRAIIFMQYQIYNPVISSYIYPEAEHFAFGVYLSTETPPPKPLI